MTEKVTHSGARIYETPEDDMMALRAVATAARAVAAAGMKPETLAGHAALTHLYEALDALDSSYKNKPPAETPAALEPGMVEVE